MLGYYNPVLYTCPFCPVPEGDVFVSGYACSDRREEAPDPLYWHDGTLNHPQNLIRFGADTDRRTPCRHMVFLRGVVAWHDQNPEPDLYTSASAAGWGIEFDWTPPRYHAVDQGVGMAVMGDPDCLLELAAACTPRVRMHVDRPRFSWHALRFDTYRSSVYSVNALFVAASRPERLRAAVAARIQAIRQFLDAKGGTGKIG